MRNFSVWVLVACVVIAVAYATPDAKPEPEPEPEALAKAEPKSYAEALAEPEPLFGIRKRRQARKNKKGGQKKHIRNVQKKALVNNLKPKKCNCMETPDCDECKQKKKWISGNDGCTGSGCDGGFDGGFFGGDLDIPPVEAPICPGVFPIPYPVDDLERLYGFI